MFLMAPLPFKYHLRQFSVRFERPSLQQQQKDAAHALLGALHSYHPRPLRTARSNTTPATSSSPTAPVNQSELHCCKRAQGQR